MFNKVLVVNDNDILLFTARKILVKSQCTQEIVTAVNGLLAIEYLDQQLADSDLSKALLPELIILDLHMPVMDGWDFLQTFHKKYAALCPNTRIIILSASIDPNDSNELHKYPFVLDEVIDTINLDVIQQIKEKYYTSVADDLTTPITLRNAI